MQTVLSMWSRRIAATIPISATAVGPTAAPMGGQPTTSRSSTNRTASVPRPTLQNNSPATTAPRMSALAPSAAQPSPTPTRGTSTNTTVSSIPTNFSLLPPTPAGSTISNAPALAPKTNGSAPRQQQQPSTAPLTPKKPLENDCPYDVEGNGEPSMDMSSTSIALVLETTNNAELVIPPPDTNAVSTTDEDYNDENSTTTASSLLLPSSSIICTFPEYGDLTFQNNGTRLIYEPYPTFVGTDTLVVQRHCQKRLRKKDPFAKPSKRKPPSSRLDFDENDLDSTLDDPSVHNNTNLTVVFCVIEFITIEVVASESSATTAVPDQASSQSTSKSSHSTTTTWSVLSAAVAFSIVVTLSGAFLLYRRNKHKIVAKRETIASRAAEATGSSSALSSPSTSLSPIVGESPMPLRLLGPAAVPGPARLDCSHHMPMPYDAVVDPSIPPPAILPPTPPSLVSLSLSTLSSYDARATVLAVDNGAAVPVVALPAFKDQMRSMIANNEAVHHDNSQHRRASFRSGGGGGSTPMDPPASRIHHVQAPRQLVSLPPPKVSSHELKTAEAAAAAAEAAPITVVAAIAMSHDAQENQGKFESADC